MCEIENLKAIYEAKEALEHTYFKETELINKRQEILNKIDELIVMYNKEIEVNP